MFLLILYFVIAVIVSFLCSILEASLLSTPRLFLLANKQEKKSWADLFLYYKENIDKPLSAILSINTLANTIGAAGVGAQAVRVFGEIYFGIASAVLALIILIFSEIIPKTAGAKYWRFLVGITPYLIKIMIFISYPLVIISAFITRIIAKEDKTPATSRQEISALTRVGADEGVFSSEENKIIQNVVKLKNVKVKEIMTPRVVMVVADEMLFLRDFLRSRDYLRYSRIPVYSNYPEKISGYVLRQEVFEKLALDQPELRLRDVKKEIIIVPYTKTLFGVWETLLEKKEHLAIIVDEYGGIDGLVTMEDIIETLLGLEILDEKDTISNMQNYALERWKSKQAKYRFLDDLDRDL